jgi:TNF receptor-associated protein 1
MMEKNEISDEMHNKFYKFLSNGSDDPRFTLYYKTEMPISVRSIFYIPSERPNFNRSSPDENKSEISLYCRKVLISNKTDMILPNWMRFIRGVVDSEDIPLNLSRELLQNTPLISKIRDTLTDRVIKFLNDRAKVAFVFLSTLLRK